jgi:hypothetical protein
LQSGPHFSPVLFFSNAPSFLIFYSLFFFWCQHGPCSFFAIWGEVYLLSSAAGGRAASFFIFAPPDLKPIFKRRLPVALSSVGSFSDDTEIVHCVPTAFGEWYFMIYLVYFRVEVFACPRFPLLNYLSSCRARYPS